MTVIDIENVGKTYHAATGDAVVALQDITLQIQAGEFLSLVGPSGCGKSTLLRLIADLDQPTTGRIRVNDKATHAARMNRDYGMVFQAATLYEWRTVSRNVQLPLEVMGYPPEEREQRAADMLALVELSDFADHYPWQLSGGMQQRVAIARALVFQPKILLMDEPFGALDEFTRERMNLELLDIWQKTGVTVVFVTHSIIEATFLSNRVVVLSARPGRIAGEVDVDLPYPRTPATRDRATFHTINTTLRDKLRTAHTVDHDS